MSPDDFDHPVELPTSPQDTVHEEITAVLQPEIPEELRALVAAVGDGTALAAKLRDGGQAAFLDAVDVFAQGMGFPARKFACTTTEKLMNTVFDLQACTGHPFTELMDALADAFIAQDDGSNGFDNWSHSLCHLFEKFGRGGDTSFFDSASSLPAAEKLFLENAKRAVQRRDLSNSPRTTGAVVKYNLSRLDATSLDGPFPFRPMSEDVKRFSMLFDPDSAETELFTADTPRAFLAGMVRNLKVLSKNPVQQVALLGMIAPSLSEDEVNAFLAKFGSVNGAVPSLTELQENVAEAASASEFLSGTFVDVDDTLIENGALNERIANRIAKILEGGGAVTVVTGGDPDAQTETLRALGLPEAFLPVQSKAMLRGKIVELLIDDTPPEVQGFRAKRHDQPRYTF